MLMNCMHTQVFVWVGRASDAGKQKAAQKRGQQLGQRDGRAANTPVTLVQPGKEPSLFTAAFPSWNASMASQVNLQTMSSLQNITASQMHDACFCRTCQAWQTCDTAEEL